MSTNQRTTIQTGLKLHTASPQPRNSVRLSPTENRDENLVTGIYLTKVGLLKAGIDPEKVERVDLQIICHLKE